MRPRNLKSKKEKPCLNSLQAENEEKYVEPEDFWKYLVKTTLISDKNQVVFVTIKNQIKDATKWIYEWFSINATTDAVYEFVQAVFIKPQTIKLTNTDFILEYKIKEKAAASEQSFIFERNKKLSDYNKIYQIKNDRHILRLYNNMNNV